VYYLYSDALMFIKIYYTIEIKTSLKRHVKSNRQRKENRNHSILVRCNDALVYILELESDGISVKKIRIVVIEEVFKSWKNVLEHMF
jgi:hypothetical protein